MPAESTLATFTASDGENIAVQDWPLDDGVRQRGVVLVVHGLGEHAARHQRLAQKLNDWGFTVRGYDQYGHGESDGPRGVLPSEMRLVDDLADVLESTRVRMARGAPLILLGHSMGGLVAARFASLNRAPVDALVMSSPALRTRLPRWKRLGLAALSRVAPNLVLPNGLDPDFLSHDPEVVRAYQQDRLCHDRISVRLARFIVEHGAATIARAPQWRVPTLLLFAGRDHLVDPRGSRRFAAAAAGLDHVSAHCFDELYHEIFNEEDAEPVYEMLEHWLQRFP